MALKCDVCLKPVPKSRGYALTTTQVTTAPAYWEYAFTHQWAYVGKSVGSLGFTTQEVGDVLANLAQQISSSQTPWVVCDTCIRLFSVDLSTCLERAKRFSAQMPNGWQQLTGPADLQRTLAAAKKAYRSVFQGGRDSTQKKTVTRHAKRSKQSSEQPPSSEESLGETARQAKTGMRPTRKPRSRSRAEKCDFCGRALGEHEEIALLNERVVAVMKRAGVIRHSVPPSVTDPSGQSRWVACSKCRVSSGIDDAIARGPSQKKWWQFWK